MLNRRDPGFYDGGGGGGILPAPEDPPFIYNPATPPVNTPDQGAPGYPQGYQPPAAPGANTPRPLIRPNMQATLPINFNYWTLPQQGGIGRAPIFNIPWAMSNPSGFSIPPPLLWGGGNNGTGILPPYTPST